MPTIEIVVSISVKIALWEGFLVKSNCSKDMQLTVTYFCKDVIDLLLDYIKSLHSFAI
jgi:hypothetical protein